MEHADKELKELEDMLRALAAQDRAGHAEDAALLARLCSTADTACRRARLRPWYRSPMVWRSAAALALLVALPSLWVWLQPHGEQRAVAVAAPVADTAAELAAATPAVCVAACGSEQPVAPAAMATLTPESVAETAAVAVVAECGPDALPLPQVQEPVAVLTTHETAVAVYSGGADAACDAEAAEDTWAVADTALAVNHSRMAERSMPAKLNRSVAGRKAKRAVRAVNGAAPPRRIADKLKTYAEALQRATEQP